MHYDYMPTQMMEALDQVARIDMRQALRYKTMLRLRNSMVRKEVSGAMADQVVANMKIAISERCYADTELMRTAVETIAKKVGELYAMVDCDFPSDPASVFLTLSRDFSLEMEF